MASLRARLLAAVLVLSAVGLLVVGAVTYFEQRSFQLQRIDQQARSAPPAVAGALASQGIGPAAGDPDHDPGDRPAGGPPPGAPGGGGGPRPPACRSGPTASGATRRARRSARRSSSTTARAS